MGELSFRVAGPRDLERVAELVHGTPGREAVAMCGSEAGARRFGFALTRRAASMQGLGRTILAERDGEVVGLLQWHRGRERALPPPFALAWIALSSLGLVGAVRLAWRDRTRRRVNPAATTDAFHIEELHVLPSARGDGIGGRLLAHAEAIARAQGFAQLSLVTLLDNPARRLYERIGFEVAEERRDPGYERLTGSAGRVRMVKRLHA